MFLSHSFGLFLLWAGVVIFADYGKYGRSFCCVYMVLEVLPYVLSLLDLKGGREHFIPTRIKAFLCHYFDLRCADLHYAFIHSCFEVVMENKNQNKVVTCFSKMDDKLEEEFPNVFKIFV